MRIGKQADIFADSYANKINITISQTKQREVWREQKETDQQNTIKTHEAAFNAH